MNTPDARTVARNTPDTTGHDQMFTGTHESLHCAPDQGVGTRPDPTGSHLRELCKQGAVGSSPIISTAVDQGRTTERDRAVTALSAQRSALLSGSPGNRATGRSAHVELGDQIVGAVIHLAELEPALGIAWGPTGWYDPADDLRDVEMADVLTGLAEHRPELAAHLLVALRAGAEELQR